MNNVHLHTNRVFEGAKKCYSLENQFYGVERIMVLNSRQRGILSRLAATMQPIVMVGKEGASSGVEQALRNEFKNRELIKIRFIANKEERVELAEDLARRLGATLVRIIGHVAILYRPADDPRERHIHLGE